MADDRTVAYIAEIWVFAGPPERLKNERPIDKKPWRR